VDGGGDSAAVANEWIRTTGIFDVDDGCVTEQAAEKGFITGFFPGDRDEASGRRLGIDHSDGHFIEIGRAHV
jgi:hypothetical protein